MDPILSLWTRVCQMFICDQNNYSCHISGREYTPLPQIGILWEEVISIFSLFLYSNLMLINRYLNQNHTRIKNHVSCDRTIEKRVFGKHAIWSFLYAHACFKISKYVFWILCMDFVDAVLVFMHKSKMWEKVLPMPLCCRRREKDQRRSEKF